MNDIQGARDVPPIGFQTENIRTRVAISLAEIQDIVTEYPDGMYTLAYKRQGDRCFFISGSFEVQDDTLIWTVEAAALAIKGVVEVQVSYASGSVVATTGIFKFRVRKSIISGSEMPRTFIDLISSGLSALDSTAKRAEAAEKNAEKYMLVIKEMMEGFDDLGLSVVNGQIHITYDPEMNTEEMEETAG